MVEIMIEIEMKFAVPDFAALERHLTTAGARPGTTQDEADHYFNAPDRDFKTTDEAFRLRRIGPANRITYKGPKHAGPTKTRTEIELGLEAGDATADKLCQLVQHLGYRPVAVVRKQRTTYHLTRAGYAVEVCCDTVEELGRFVEIEIMAPEDAKGPAQAALQELAQAWELGAAEPRSYLRLLLEKRGSTA